MPDMVPSVRVTAVDKKEDLLFHQAYTTVKLTRSKKMSPACATSKYPIKYNFLPTNRLNQTNILT